MENGTTSVSERAQTEGTKGQKFLSRPWLVTARILSVTLWFYVTASLFFPSLEDEFLKHYPSLGWLATYRILVILGCIALLWLISRTKNFTRIITYILWFPILLVYKAIRLNWQLFLSSTPIIYGFFQSLKFIVIGTTAFSIGVALICSADSSWAIVIGISLIAITLIVFLSRQFSAALESRTFFGKAAEAIENFWKKFHDVAVFRLPADYDLITTDGISKATTPMMFSYLVFWLFSKICG